MKDKMLTPALIGGIVIAGGSTIPILNFLNCFCCAWVVLGGLSASYMYIRNSPERVTLGDGAMLGACAALAGSVIGTLLSIPFNFLAPDRSAMIRERRVDMPEGIRSMVLGMADSSSFSFLGIIVQFFAWLVIGLVFATLGGIIGVAAFEKRKNGGELMPPPPSLPPTPPVPPVIPPPGM